ncbi:fungal-specific transcription factor domain-containing protein [Xylariales sp. PMI_506]|nr:fungal-specific transcription factor domain-containing protein [Xylariales sp. PMI_506]
MADGNALFPVPERALRPHPGHRRDKPQLSCYSCRRRKLRCDRLNPCSNCLAPFLGSSLPQKHSSDESACTYKKAADAFKASAPQCKRKLHVIAPALRDLSNYSAERLHRQQRSNTQDTTSTISSASSTDLRLTEFGTGYKDSAHWASVLNGVTEFKEHGVQQNATQILEATDEITLPLYQSVLLFEGCTQATERELRAALPSRAIADALIASYFPVLEFANSNLLLTNTQYNRFWENPSTAPISWFALLYSIFCLAAQFQTTTLGVPGRSIQQNSPDTILYYREKVVQCLISSQYAKGGPFIVETLIHYVIIENSLRRDANPGVWLLLGNVVQIAIRMGHHRDPHHFKSLSPYEGEMRRRTWALIYILDVEISVQLGLPRIIRPSISDTLRPRNLQDDDFDAESKELPPSRPDRELTKTSLIITKLHIVSILGTVWEIVSNPRPCSKEDVAKLSTKLDEAIANIPEPCKFRSFSESLLDSPIVISKYLAVSRDPGKFVELRKTAVEAAIKSLEFQHIMEEDIRTAGRLRIVSCIQSSVTNHGYLLATSVICHYVRYCIGTMVREELEKIQSLLRKTNLIWSRFVDSSVEAKKATEALKIVLQCLDRRGSASETQSEEPSHPVPEAKTSIMIDYFKDFQMPLTSFDSLFENLPLIFTESDPFGGSVSLIDPVIDFFPQSETTHTNQDFGLDLLRENL